MDRFHWKVPENQSKRRILAGKMGAVRGDMINGLKAQNRKGGNMQNNGSGDVGSRGRRGGLARSGRKRWNKETKASLQESVASSAGIRDSSKKEKPNR